MQKQDLPKNLGRGKFLKYARVPLCPKGPVDSRFACSECSFWAWAHHLLHKLAAGFVSHSQVLQISLLPEVLRKQCKALAGWEKHWVEPAKAQQPHVEAMQAKMLALVKLFDAKAAILNKTFFDKALAVVNKRKDLACRKQTKQLKFAFKNFVVEDVEVGGGKHHETAKTKTLRATTFFPPQPPKHAEAQLAIQTPSLFPRPKFGLTSGLVRALLLTKRRGWLIA